MSKRYNLGLSKWRKLVSNNDLRRAKTRKNQPHTPPALETLEPRLLLSGTIYTVTSLDDSIAQDGFITLREAIESANTNTSINEADPGSSTEVDIINFSPSLFTGGAQSILLDGSQLQITEDLTIQGPGQNLLTIDANSQSRVISISGDDTDQIIQISDLTITGGYASGEDSYGGGINVINSSLNLTNSTVINNFADSAGGISSYNGDLTLTNSKVVKNTATSAYGGIIAESNNLTINNSIIAANAETNLELDDVDAAIYLDVSQTIVINNSTIVGQFTNEGFVVSTTINNSIITEYFNVGLGTTTIDNSLINGDFSDFGFGTTITNSITDTDPLFIRAANPGGDLTWGTFDDDPGDLHLQPTSPALNTGANNLIPLDTNDLDNDGDTTEPLPIDLDGNQRVIDFTVDMGAYEHAPTAAYPTIEVDEDTDLPNNVHTLSFDDLQLGQSDSQDITINNTGSAPLTITRAAGLNAPYSITPVNTASSADDWVIQPGQSMQLTVTFTAPQTSGLYTDTLSLISDDPYTPDYQITFSTLVDDHANSITNATPLPNNTTASGELESLNDDDFFTFTAQEDYTYTFETSLDTLFDTVLFLYNQYSAIPFAQDDDSGTGNASKITWTATDSGDFYIKVNSFGGNHIGTYTLTSTETPPPGDDHGNDASSATPVAINSLTPGDIEEAGDVDWFSFQAVKDGEYTFTTRLGSLDSVISLIDHDGITVLQHVDTLGESSITWTATETNTFFIEVRDYFGTNPGTFDLEVTGPSIPGDLDNNGVVNFDDADFLANIIYNTTPINQDLAYDFNNDLAVTPLDGQRYVVDFLQTSIADFDDNGIVNIADLIVWAQNFGSSDPAFSKGDANFDGYINIADLIAWAQNFGFNNNLAPVTAPLTSTSAAVAAPYTPIETNAPSDFLTTQSSTANDNQRWNNITSLINKNNAPASLLFPTL